MKFLAADKAELTEELNIINPDVILCGNTLHLLQAVNIFPGARKGVKATIIFGTAS